MNIGEASAASGVSAKMIRHYEALGLVAPARRMNNYRAYGPKEVAQLQLVSFARELNMPLPEVRQLLRVWDLSGEQQTDATMEQIRKLEPKINAMANINWALDSLQRGRLDGNPPPFPTWTPPRKTGS